MTEKKTTESKEARKVARAFLFQSISYEDLPEDISSVDFTRTIQIKKNKDSSNPGQVMAIGGGVEKGETPEEAIKREVLQETGVIMSDFKRLETQQEYSYQHKTKGNKKNHATFFVGNLYPHGIDIPYVLDNEADRIEKFEYFTAHDLYLWFSGKDERKVLDSLELNKKSREAENTVADRKVIQKVRVEVLMNACLAEIKKKISVIEKVYQFKSVKSEDKKVFETEERLGNMGYKELWQKYKEINKYWTELVQKTNLTKSELSSILRFANVEEVLLDMNKTYFKGKAKHGEGFMIPTFAMMFPLLFGLNFDEKLLYLINSSPIFKKFYFVARMLGILNQIRKMNGKEKENKINSFNKLLERLQPGLNLNDKVQFEEGTKLGEVFIEILGRFRIINTKKNPEIQDTLSEIDGFFNFLEGQSKAKENKVSLIQKNEVASARFETILQRAFGDMSRLNVGENDKKRIIFEAQRKLILAIFFLDLRGYFTKVNKQTAELVTDLENSLSVIIERGPGESETRKWKLGEKEYKVLVDFRAKSFESFVRKVFVRDIYNQNLINDIKDFYGQSIIFDKLDEGDLIQRKRDIPENCIFRDNTGKDINKEKEGKFTAEQPVFDYINDMCRLAGEEGSRVEILEYKEFKDGSAGNSISSSDKIRMRKFYIKVINNEKEESTKEIQIYLPGEVVNEKGELEHWTGTQFYNYKKEDDARYSLDRLFVEGNVTSFIGLFFPAYIYGEEIAKLFTGKF